MRKHRSSILSGVLALVAILLAANSLMSQPKAGGPGWQYCTLTPSNIISPARAEICYATAAGCRNETVPLNDSRFDSGEAVMAAAQRLGDQGWELIAATDSNRGRTLYFKRLKALDNQHPLGN